MRVLDFCAYGIRESWIDGIKSVAPLPWRNDVWIEIMAPLDSRRRGSAPSHSKGARSGHQLFRHRRHVFGGEERGSSRPRVERLRTGPRPHYRRDESLYADE